MKVLISVDVVAEQGETINPADVAKDLQLYLMDFTQTEKSNDVIGGFAVTRATSTAVE
jgi:hypothetical protein